MSQGTLSDVKTKGNHQLDFVFLTSQDKKFVVMWYSPPYILRKTVADDDITMTTDCPNNVWQVILCNNTVFPFSLMLLFSIHFISIDLYVLALEMVHSCINPSILCCNPSHCSIVHPMVKCAGTETFYQMCSVDSFHNPEPIAMWVGWQIRLCFLAHCSARLHENAAWPPKSHYHPNTICRDEGISNPTL